MVCLAILVVPHFSSFFDYNTSIVFLFFKIFTCLCLLNYQEEKSAINEIKKIHKISEKDLRARCEFFSEHSIFEISVG